MSEPSESEVATKILREWDEAHPDVVALAMVASLARRIEPELLRALRLELRQSGLADEQSPTVGTEATLWFSPFVESRGPDSITLLPEFTALLRERLRDRSDLLEAACRIIAKCHAAAPPVVRWEEKLIYLCLSAEATDAERRAQLDREIWRAIKALASGRRRGLGEWIVEMGPRLPQAAQGVPLLARLQAATYAGLARDRTSRDVLRLSEIDFANAPQKVLEVARLRNLLRIGELGRERQFGIRVPAFEPVTIEILRPGESGEAQTFVVPAGSYIEFPISEEGSLHLRAMDGKIYDLSFDATPSRRDFGAENLPNRNPFFTGREHVLEQLREALVARSRAALSGLGGIGKTQIAVEYAHRHSDEYAYRLWATADSYDALVSSYETIASLLKLSKSSTQGTAAVEAVKRWLGSNQGWLLILDNADDIVMALEFIPPGRNGHVILTTQARDVGASARRVDIQKMETQEGAFFLLRRAKYIGELAPLDAVDEADLATANEIITQLDGLPLALDQAGAYIEETVCGLAVYLELYRHHGLELLRIRGGLPSDHPDPVATTWALSFENVEKASPVAAELLRFCAFLHPDGIPEEVFRKGAPELGPVLGPVGSDALALNSSISEILKYSLLRHDPTTSTFEIHRLLQTVLKRGMDEANQRLWAERAVRAVNLVFPNVEFSNWSLCERLLPQAQACAELIDQWGFEFPESMQLLNRAGFYLFERGRYNDAEFLCQRALTIGEKALGPDHVDLATSLSNLAELYRAQGAYDKAESLFKRGLAILESALGPDHPDVATSLNNLAKLYVAQSQYNNAESLFQRGLMIREKALVPDHPNVATSLSNLAELYVAQSQYDKAEPLFRRALVIREKALGPEHPEVATSLNNLAALYNALGKYANAEPLYRQALAINEKVLGPEHPNVATSLEGYAVLLRKMSRPDEAAPLESRAKTIRANGGLIRNPDSQKRAENEGRQRTIGKKR